MKFTKLNVLRECLNCSDFPKQTGGDEISYNAILVPNLDVYDSVIMSMKVNQLFLEVKRRPKCSGRRIKPSSIANLFFRGTISRFIKPVKEKIDPVLHASIIIRKT